MPESEDSFQRADAGIEAFLPALTLRWLSEKPAGSITPRGERFFAAVLFADIVAFTALAERLARQEGGAEQVQRILNRCFGRLVELIGEHGGEVFKFAGDATLVLWPTEDREDLAEAVLRASQCGLAIQHQLDGFEAVRGVRLRFRVSIGAGDVWAAMVGGTEDRWESLIAGAPLRQLRTALQRAEPGGVVLSGEAWTLAARRCEGRALEQGCAQLNRVAEPVAPRPAAAPVVPGEAHTSLRAFIPRTILSYLDAGQARWLAELRRVTVVFLGIRGFEYESSGALERLQTIMTAMQEPIYRYEGSITQLIADDKGTTLIATWGLALRTHEDDAERGLRAAQAIRSALAGLPVTVSAGITTGQVFAGRRGGHRRMEYAIIGDTVNLAARLQQAAEQGILCDAATRAAAASRIPLEELPPITVAGKAEPVAVFRPGSGQVRARKGRRELIGREAERRLLADALAALSERRGGIVVIEGEAGIGKSELVLDLQRRSEEMGLRSLIGAATAIEQNTPYRVWRDPFEDLLGVRDKGDEDRWRRLEAHLETEEQRLWAPLLEPVLALGLPSNEIVDNMSAKGRSETTRELLVHLFRSVIGDSPTVVVLDDVHWLDSASWALARTLHRRVPNLLLVLVSRPQDRDLLPSDARQLLGAEDAAKMRLERLSPESTVDLVCRRLGVESIPPAVVDLILAKAEGNPFFSEELAFSLRQRGLIEVVEGRCRLTVDSLDSLSAPDTVQGVITGRIDLLATPLQLTAKVASVLGRTFPLGALVAVHPSGTERRVLEDQLATMADLGVVGLEPAADTYSFRHSITRDVVYGLLPFAQRRELHRAAAEWHEARFAADSSYYPVLAEHWTHARIVPKAMDWLDKAGDQSLQTGVYREASVFFRRVLDLIQGEPRDREAEGWQGVEALATTPLQRARWMRKLGQAYHGTGSLSRARDELEAAAALLGAAVPRTSWRAYSSLLGQAAVQAAHRLRDLRAAGTDASERKRSLQEASTVLTVLSTIYYVAHQPSLNFYALLRKLNLAERATPSASLIRGYTGLSYLSGFFGLKRLAMGYQWRALQACRQVNDPQARAEAHHVRGILLLTWGEWPECRRRFAEARSVYRRYGERESYLTLNSTLAYAEQLSGNLARADALNEEGLRESTSMGYSLHEMYAHGGLASVAMQRGDLESAATRAEAAVRLCDETSESAAKVIHLGTLAYARMRLGDAVGARESVESALRLIASSPYVPSAYHAFAGYRDVAETALALWAAGDPDGRRLALPACGALRRFAWVFRYGRPSALRSKAQVAWLRGARSRAQRGWQAALVAAREMRMPYEVGRTCYELGRHLATDDPRRAGYLRQAAETFRKLGAEHDLRLAIEAEAAGSISGT